MTTLTRRCNDIKVDDVIFTSSISITETVVDIIIEAKSAHGQKLRIGFYYNDNMPDRLDFSSIEIPDALIHKLILFARKRGWEPLESGLVEFFIYAEEAGPVDWSVN